MAKEPELGRDVLDLRKRLGIDIDLLSVSDSDLLRCATVERLVSSDAGPRLRARALYGAIHTLVRRGAKNGPSASRAAHWALAYALNIKIYKVWNGSYMPLMPDIDSVERRREIAAGKRSHTRIWPIPDLRWLDNSNLSRREDRAWRLVIKSLTDTSGEVPDELLSSAAEHLAYDSETRSMATHLGRMALYDPPYHVDRPFFGRLAERQQIVDMLEGLHVPIAITGPAGIGKTQLASQVALEMRERDVHIVGFIDCSGLDSLESLARFGYEAGAYVDESLPLEEQVAKTRSFLASTNVPWLLVLDNLDSPDEYVRLSPPYGGRSRGAVLLTSRKNLAIPGIEVVPVGSLTDDAAEQMLKSLAGRPHDPMAGELARSLGNYPLALLQAGSYCSDGVPFADYLRIIENSEIVDISEDVDLYAGHGRTLYGSWLNSFEKAWETYKYAPTVFCISAFLDGTKIQEDLLHSGEGEGADEYAIGLRTLSHYNLIERSDRYFEVHPLLQRLCREYLARNDKRHFALSALQSITRFLPRDANLLEDAGRLQAIAPHLIVWANTVNIDVCGPKDTKSFLDTVDLVSEYAASAQSPAGQVLAARLVLVAEKFTSKTSVAYGKLVQNRAMAAAIDLGFDSFAESVRGFEIVVDAPDSNRDDVSLGLVLLAYALITQGRFSEARRFLARLVPIADQVAPLLSDQVRALEELVGEIDDGNLEEAFEGGGAYLRLVDSLFGELEGDDDVDLEAEMTDEDLLELVLGEEHVFVTQLQTMKAFDDFKNDVSDEGLVSLKALAVELLATRGFKDQAALTSQYLLAYAFALLDRLEQSIVLYQFLATVHFELVGLDNDNTLESLGESIRMLYYHCNESQIPFEEFLARSEELVSAVTGGVVESGRWTPARLQEFVDASSDGSTATLLPACRRLLGLGGQ